MFETKKSPLNQVTKTTATFCFVLFLYTDECTNLELVLLVTKRELNKVKQFES